LTLFDLLFLALAFFAVATLIGAVVLAIGGHGSRAATLLLRLAICAAAYIGIVYAATAFSKPKVLTAGEPQCSDDWCLAVETANRSAKSSTVVYDVTLRIFSRARRVSQRELSAKDVYLVDANWWRYDPLPHPAEPPLNTLLQPEQSVLSRRRFELPAGARDIGLLIDHSQPPFCLIIGECGAFHREPVFHFDPASLK
jgi:hypothetical protein